MMARAWCCSCPMRSQPPRPTALPRVSSRLCARLMLARRHGPGAPRARSAGPGRAAPRAQGPAFLPASCTMAGCGALVFARQRVEQLLLPVARDAGNAHHLAGARTSRSMASSGTPNGSVAGKLQVARVQHHFAALSARCVSRGGSAPIIRRDSEALDSCAGLHTPVTLARAHHRAGAAQLADPCSLWLM